MNEYLQIKRIRLIALAILLFALFSLTLYALRTSLYPNAIPSQTSSSIPTSHSSIQFLLSNDSQVGTIANLFDNDMTKVHSYNEVLDFNFGKAVVTKQNEIYFVEFDANGDIKREVLLGVRPDLVLSMARRLILDESKDYFVIVIPLRGFRVFQIDAVSQVSENYYPVNEFFRLFSDNSIFQIGRKIYIPAGDTTLYTIDIDANKALKENMDPSPCGAKPWEINHNMDNLFVMKSSDEICVFDLTTGKVVNKFSLSGDLWFKLVPERSLLLAEPWETLNEFPSSTGIVDIYELTTGQKISQVNLSTDESFKNQRGASPGGYSLIGEHLIDGDSLYLFTRAGVDKYALQLDKELKLVKFEKVGQFNYSNVVKLDPAL